MNCEYNTQKNNHIIEENADQWGPMGEWGNEGTNVKKSKFQELKRHSMQKIHGVW